MSGSTIEEVACSLANVKLAMSDSSSRSQVINMLSSLLREISNEVRLEL